MRKLVTAAYIADGRRRPVAMITGFVSLLPITSEAVIFGIYHSLSQTNQSEYVRMYSRVRRARVDSTHYISPHMPKLLEVIIEHNPQCQLVFDS